MRILATFAASFAAGVFAAQYLLPETGLLPAAMACLGLSLLFLLLRGSARTRVLLIGWGLAAALSWNWGYARVVQAPAEALAGTDRTVTMTLCGYAQPTAYGARATVRLDCLAYGKAVYYGGEELLDLTPGQTLTGAVHLQSAGRIREDDVTTFTSKGVFLLAYQRGEAVAGEGSGRSPRWWPARLGRALQDNISALFAGDTAGFLRAILTGDKAGLSEAAAIDLSEAGVYHLMAVSGMHCAFLLGFAELLTGKHRRRLTAAAAIPVLLFYMLLAGCTPSVVRACVMLVLLLLAPLFRRDRDGPTAMTSALLLILLQNPFAAKSVSLQLSFAAVAGLLWLTPRLDRFLLEGVKRRGRAARFVAASVSASCGALVFTVPLTALYFNHLVLVAPLANLLCLWAASIVFASGLLAAVAAFFWLPLGRALGLVPSGLIWYLLQASHLLAKLPFHAVYFTNPYLKVWLAYAYLLFGAAWLMKPKSRRKYAVAGLCAAVTLACTVKLGQLRLTSSALDADVLDVGQGSATLLSSGGVFALVDCGSGNSWYSAGELAADRLLTMGCRELDYLVLTHYDADHVNGVTGLLARLRVKTLLVPAGTAEAELRETVLTAARAAGTGVVTIGGETAYPLGSCVLTVYPPLGEGSENEAGLAALATCGTFDLLITGDMGAATERRLLETFDLPDVEVLVAGHHGSKTSTSAELLEAVRPELGIVSVGSNAYGHPAGETLARLARAGAEICRTDLQGSIHLSVN